MRRGHHDIGGLDAGPVGRREHVLAFWERRIEAMRDCLGKRAEPVVRTDELRRVMEAMDRELYESLAFYERKAWSLRAMLIEKGIVTADEVTRRLAAVKERRDTAVAAMPAAFDHRHDHEDIKEDEARPSDYDALGEAIYEVLVEKQVLSADEVRAMIERMEDAGPAKGARIVAHAWTDPAFKARLLADGKRALAEIGIESLETQLIVVENEPSRHNVIVCTLCSCYPRSVLGSPPAWYVSKPYRARTVREPRKVLAEFGYHVPEQTEVVVHDSTADMRYMVLPMRPAGTEGWSEPDLAKLVTRDSLIGVAPALRPVQRIDGHE
jgi:nitrile hydratase alpha subunit